MIKPSIKGFELRNVKHFLGHEQEDCYQGYIYYKGKKVGYYSDDSWGGSAIIDFDNIEYDKLFRDKAKEYLEKASQRGFSIEALPTVEGHDHRQHAIVGQQAAGSAEQFGVGQRGGMACHRAPMVRSLQGINELGRIADNG